MRFVAYMYVHVDINACGVHTVNIILSSIKQNKIFLLSDKFIFIFQ
jgi:hypothetical protein